MFVKQTKTYIFTTLLRYLSNFPLIPDFPKALYPPVDGSNLEIENLYPKYTQEDCIRSLNRYN